MGNCQDTVFKGCVYPRPGLPVYTRANSVAVPCFGVACLTRIYDAQADVLVLGTVDTKVACAHRLRPSGCEGLRCCYREARRFRYCLSQSENRCAWVTSILEKGPVSGLGLSKVSWPLRQVPECHRAVITQLVMGLPFIIAFFARLNN